VTEFEVKQFEDDIKPSGPFQGQGITTSGQKVDPSNVEEIRQNNNKFIGFYGCSTSI